MRRVRYMVGLSLGWAAIAGPVSAAQLRIAARSLPAQFHPVLMRSADEQFLRELIHAKLIVADPHWRYQCSLCESIPLPETAKTKAAKTKAKTPHLLNWRIRKDMKWASGVPVTGWDIRFSFELHQAARALRGDRNRSAIRSVIVNDQDAAEFAVQLDSNISDYLYDLDFPIVPAAIEEPIWIAANKDLNRYLNQSEYGKNPFNKDLYAGCYFPVRKDGSGLELGVQANCASGRPQFDGARIELIAPNLKSSIQSQKFDVIPENVFGPELKDWITPEARRTIDSFSGYQFSYALDSRKEILILNLRNPLFADRKMREILADAIDAQEIQRLLGWPGEVSRGIFSTTTTDLGQSPSPTPSTSPQPARKTELQLRESIQALRFKPGPDGIWQRDGQSLSFVLTYLPEPNFRRRVADHLREKFKKIGIDLKLKEVTSDEFRNEIFARSFFPDFTIVSWEIRPGVIPFSLLHSTAIPGSDNQYRGQNIAGIFSKKIDETLSQWAAEFDQSRQAAIREELNRLFISGTYAVELSQRPKMAAISQQIEGFVLPSHERPSSIYASQWQPVKEHRASP